jgi:hypothetical protein
MFFCCSKVRPKIEPKNQCFMKISFRSLVRRHQQRKDKTFPVNIRIGFKSKYAFIQTDFVASKSDLKGLSLKNDTIKTKCDTLIIEFKDIVSKITNIETLDVSDIVNYIRKGINTEKEIDFLKFFKEFVLKEEKNNSPQLSIYKATYNHLSYFVNYHSLPINKIGYKFLSDFENYLSSKEIGSRQQYLV